MYVSEDVYCMLPGVYVCVSVRDGKSVCVCVCVCLNTGRGWGIYGEEGGIALPSEGISRMSSSRQLWHVPESSPQQALRAWKH